MNQETPEPIAFTQNQREEVRILGDKASTLAAQPGTHQQTYIAEPVVLLERAAFNAGVNALYTPFIGETHTTPTLVAKGPHAVLTPIAYSIREDATANTFHCKEVEVAHCVTSLRPSPMAHHAQNFVAQPTAYILDSFTSNSMLSDNPNSGCREVDKTKCLDTSCLNPTANQGGVMVVQKLYENHPNDSRVTGPLDVAPTVVSRYGTGGGNVPLVNTEHKSHWEGGETHPTLNAGEHSGSPGYSNQEIFSQKGAGLVPAIPIQDGRELEKHQNGLGIGKAGEPAYTLDTTGAQAVAQPLAVDTFNQTLSPLNQTLRAGTDVDRMGGVLEPVLSPTVTTCKGSKGGSSTEAIAELIAVHQAEQAVAFQPGNLRRQAGADPSTETFPTLKCDSGDQSPHVATIMPNQSQGVDLFNQTLTGDVHVPLRTAQGHGAPAAIAPTLTASNDPSRSPQSSEVTQQVNAVHQVTMAVRRLTPRECERLQGFPDDWSQIPWKGKPASECPDGPRYKACGNSMAVPVMRWIGSRINAKHTELYGNP